MIPSNAPAPVRGTRRTDLIPHIRKIDLMSSNSYILSGEDQIALIDPGALDEQWYLLLDDMLGLMEERPRPVVIYLTHIHLDHCYQLRRCREERGLGRVLVAMQEKGADALEAQDSRLTLAGLLGREMYPFLSDIRLLSAEDRLIKGERRLESGDAALSYSTISTKMGSDKNLISQQIPLGAGDLLEIYPLPGHSPDSICLRAGSILFLGDLFFAPNPGTAGAYGWSQTDLLNSIEMVLWILDQKDIHACFPGHGRAVDADEARRILRSMYRDVLSLSGLEEINPLWARNTAAYAQDLMAELERLFIIITGRLAYTSYVLNAIEEAGESERLQSLVDAAEIDELFSRFHGFVRELRSGRRLNWELVHKAGQMVGKLDLILEDSALKPTVNQSLIRKARRLLSDYSITYRGYRPAYCASSLEINPLLREVMDLVEFRSYDEAAIIEAEDHQAYLKQLCTRIDHIDVFERVTMELAAGQSLPPVQLEKERFLEAMTDLLERLAARGASRLILSSAMEDDLVFVRITLQGDCKSRILEESELRFFERAFALSGCFIEIDNVERPMVVISLLPSVIFE
jgi:glyoxylase-like metal-dependent hydrolase (beta-lactamase superfamily II)